MRPELGLTHVRLWWYRLFLSNSTPRERRRSAADLHPLAAPLPPVKRPERGLAPRQPVFVGLRAAGAAVFHVARNSGERRSAASTSASTCSCAEAQPPLPIQVPTLAAASARFYSQRPPWARVAAPLPGWPATTPAAGGPRGGAARRCGRRPCVPTPRVARRVHGAAADGLLRRRRTRCTCAPAGAHPEPGALLLLEDRLLRADVPRTHMDVEGWLPIQLLASFNRLRHITTDRHLVAEVTAARRAPPPPPPRPPDATCRGDRRRRAPLSPPPPCARAQTLRVLDGARDARRPRAQALRLAAVGLPAVPDQLPRRPAVVAGAGLGGVERGAACGDGLAERRRLGSLPTAPRRAALADVEPVGRRRQPLGPRARRDAVARRGVQVAARQVYCGRTPPPTSETAAPAPLAAAIQTARRRTRRRCCRRRARRASAASAAPPPHHSQPTRTFNTTPPPPRLDPLSIGLDHFESDHALALELARRSSAEEPVSKRSRTGRACRPRPARRGRGRRPSAGGASAAVSAAASAAAAGAIAPPGRSPPSPSPSRSRRRRRGRGQRGRCRRRSTSSPLREEAPLGGAESSLALG